MKTFAFVSTMAAYPWGGSEELWSRTAVLLREAGHAVAATVWGWPSPSPKVRALEERGIILNHRHTRLGLSERFWRRVFGERELHTQRRWLSRVQPNLVVISQGGATDGLDWMQSCAAEGLPYVVIAQYHSEAQWPADDRAEKLAEAYRNARRAFFVSRRNKHLLEDQIGERLPNAEVVWNPFNVPWADPPPWPRDQKALRLACVARLEPATKGQDLILHVLESARWRGRDLEVTYYGAGPCERGLRRLAGLWGLDRVKFSGHVDDVRSIWERHHLLLLPSRGEGMPLALLEAMLCARGAIVTDVGGNAEVVEDGVSGFVAAAPTVRCLEEAMERAWDRRGSLEAVGAAARNRTLALVPPDPAQAFFSRLLACVS